MSRSPASLRLRGPVAALAAAAAAACYVLAVRPRLLRWGASTQESAGPLPGDELVRTPRMQSTRAVTINAPAADVWPWLVQLGAGRGGMYSYDALENAAGLGMRSADRILPEYQRLDVGDVIPLGPDVGIPVRRLETGSVLGLGGTMDPRTGKITALRRCTRRPAAGTRLDICPATRRRAHHAAAVPDALRLFAPGRGTDPPAGSGAHAIHHGTAHVAGHQVPGRGPGPVTGRQTASVPLCPTPAAPAGLA